MNSAVISRLGICLAVFLAGFALSAQAVNLYKWIDKDGNVTYQDTPPPDNVDYEEQAFGEDDPERQTNLEVTSLLGDAVEQNPIIFYAIPNCDACDLVRLFLETNQMPFAEKDVQDNLTVQAELTDLTGELRVPTIVIGDLIVDGYSKSALRDALGSRGYPISELESGEVELVTADGETYDPATGAASLSDEQLDSIGNAFEDSDAGNLEDGAEQLDGADPENTVQ